MTISKLVLGCILVFAPMAQAQFQEHKLEMSKAIMTVTGVKDHLQTFGETLSQTYLAMDNGPSSQAFAAFVKFNLQKYDLYSMTAGLASESLTEVELGEVLNWYAQSPLYVKIRTSQQNLKALGPEGAKMELMAFLQAPKAAGEDVRHMLITKINELSFALTLGKNVGYLTYALYRNLNSGRSPAQASSQDAEAMQQIEASVEQSMLIQTAFFLKDLDENELRQYVEFLSTESAIKWNRAYTNYYYLGMKASFMKGLGALKGPQAPNPIPMSGTI